MNFIEHSDLVGTHAFLSPSQNAWTNYTNEKLEQRYLAAKAVERGTRLHEFAAEAIRLNRKQSGRDTLSLYVNDAIGLKMKPEQPLFYSFNCYGTADAIAYRRNVLRIHDLKTGKTPAHFEQLELYAALFCLKYLMKPDKIKMELRLYQANEVQVLTPEPDDIFKMMDAIRKADTWVNEMKAKG